MDNFVDSWLEILASLRGKYIFMNGMKNLSRQPFPRNQEFEPLHASEKGMCCHLLLIWLQYRPRTNSRQRHMLR